MKHPAPTPQPATSTPPVSDETLREFMGYHMKRAFNVVQADLSLTLKPFGLRMLTYSALVLIVDNPGLSQSQLAAAMDVERPNLVVIIDALEQRALIIRERVPTDRRAYALMATLAGRQLYDKAIAAVKAHEERVFLDIDKDTRKTVIAAMQLIQNRSFGS
ncbi:MarR family transcriptional regulator [Sulfitobacter sp. SK012]|uniref:MarR family winged helix-turn-helix transcriptional regulator n=1 Tax=Sulfitobacter sp. SK012 TaxID=1389005 RepID=UPI000E0BFC17|nr:MarR family transcriptional regulator [Sulfitobacter sp. SK012]AXI48071.1 MarR family transcriptional regulator [Sulfitobacter sp. SK012]